MKKKRTIKDHFISNVDVLYLFCGVMTIEFIFRAFLGFPVFAVESLLYDIWFAGFLSSLLFLMGRKTRLFYSLFVLLVLGILGLIQVLHYQYFTTFFSFSKASILSEFFTVKSEVTGKLKLNLFVFLIPAVISPIFFIIRKKAIHYSWTLRTGITGLTALFCIINMVITVKTYPVSDLKTESDAYLYSTLYNKVRAVEQLGFYSYSIKDFQLTLLPQQSTEIPPEEIIADYIENHGYHQETNEYTGIFKGKNLVLVLCESLSPVVIREDLTPTLYKMSQEGINFVNHYAPVYQSATADSEFISLTSMIPSISAGPIAYDFTDNTFPVTLPKLLNAEGYFSNSFHSFEGSFYNREILHKNYGFEHLYDWEEFEFEKRDNFLRAYNWMLDKDLFRQTIEKTAAFEERPFFDFVITVSGHIPYDRYRYELEQDLWYATEALGDFDVNYSTEAIAYFAAQRTLEQGLYALIDQLTVAGELENTVIAIYGDHYPYGLTESAQKEIFKLDQDYMIYKTPFIIWTPGMESKTIDSVTSTYDIFPTLANLFGLDLENDLITGRDALSETPGIVIFEDSSWLTDDAYYDSTKREIRKLNNSVTDKEIQEINEAVIEKLTIGQSILDTDYFAEKTSSEEGEQ